MAREQNDFTRRSEESAVRTHRPQARPGIWRCGPENRARRRAGDRLPEQRSGSGDPQPLQQSFASCVRATHTAGRVHGQKSAQIAALAGLLLFLAGCAAHREPPPRMPAPPPAAPASTPVPQHVPTPTPTPAPTPASPRASRSDTEITVPKDAKVLYTEVGFARWYEI